MDKQIGIWERRVKGLRRMLLGWDQARPPDAPASVVVDVTGDNSISVQILEPFEGAIGTKFKGKPQQQQLCTVVSRSRGFARFDLTFCHPVNRSSMVNACGLQQCGRRAGAARLDKLPWHHGRPVSHCGTHAGTSVLSARRLRQCQGMGQLPQLGACQRCAIK